jgi:hypothetical protein
MEIGDWSATAELNGVLRQARALGLESNLLELEAYGFTVVEPEKLDAGDLPERLLRASVRLCEQAEASGRRKSSPTGADADYSRILYSTIVQDEAFAEGLMHPVTLTIARYLLGASCRAFTTASFVKRVKATSTPIHLDTAGAPPPLYPFQQILNISWILTDYTEAAGTFGIVPGSHRFCRHPLPSELPKVMGGSAEDNCIPVEAKAGSLIVFGGNTWHGTYPKTTPELRAHAVFAFCRNYMLPAENFDDVPQALFDRYGPELANLLGRNAWQGYKTEGPEGAKIAAVARAQFVPSA